MPSPSASSTTPSAPTAGAAPAGAGAVPLLTHSGIDLRGIPVDTTAPVMVTGGTGYLGSWVVRGLLEAGATVHAAVRNPDDAAKVAHLEAAAQAGPGRLRLFAADLLQEGSYDRAMEGCAVVIHTASPFIRAVSDPQRDLVTPALEGTRNVLGGVERTASVRRVVLTSSVAAMCGDAADLEDYPGRIVAEDSWNASSSLDHEPYSYSKTLAEKEAWRVAQGQERWRLTTIHPSFILGPALNASPTSDSFSIVQMILEGALGAGAPDIRLSAVDVREVAQAHIAAAFLPGAHGRYIVSAEDTDILSLARSLRPRFGRALRLPSRPLPGPLLLALAPRIGLTRRYVRRNAGCDYRVDAARSRRELGIRYRPVQESMEVMAAQMLARAARTPKSRGGAEGRRRAQEGTP